MGWSRRSIPRDALAAVDKEVAAVLAAARRAAWAELTRPRDSTGDGVGESVIEARLRANLGGEARGAADADTADYQ